MGFRSLCLRYTLKLKSTLAAAGDLHFYMRHSYQPARPQQPATAGEPPAQSASAGAPREKQPAMPSAASRQLFSDGARSEPYR